MRFYLTANRASSPVLIDDYDVVNALAPAERPASSAVALGQEAAPSLPPSAQSVAPNGPSPQTAYDLIAKGVSESSQREFFGNKAEEFKRHLLLSAAVTTEGNYIVRVGCAPHMCTVEEAAFTFDNRSEKVVAIMLRNGRDIDLLARTTSTSCLLL